MAGEREERWNDRDVVRILRDVIEDSGEKTRKALDKAAADIIAAIQAIAQPGMPVSGKFTPIIGGIPMGAPVTVQMGLSGGTSTFVEFDGPGGTGNVVPGVSPTIYASDNPAVATIDTTGAWAVVSVGACNLSAADVVSPTLTVSDSFQLTVTAVAPSGPVSGVFTGIPNAQRRR